jgi:hypothetical protein
VFRKHGMMMMLMALTNFLGLEIESGTRLFTLVVST